MICCLFQAWIIFSDLPPPVEVGYTSPVSTGEEKMVPQGGRDYRKDLGPVQYPPNHNSELVTMPPDGQTENPISGSFSLYAASQSFIYRIHPSFLPCRFEMLTLDFGSAYHTGSAAYACWLHSGERRFSEGSSDSYGGDWLRSESGQTVIISKCVVPAWEHGHCQQRCFLR